MSLDRNIEIPDVLRPGFPASRAASANSRLSLGLGLGVLGTPTSQNQPSTTIRLISNNANLSYYTGKNGTPQMQPFKTTSVRGDDPKAGKRAGMNSEGQLLASVIGENGTPQPQPQPFKTTSVFSDDGKPDSEGQLSVLEGEQKKSGEKSRMEKEQEAIRKKLEANRARRRSSAAHGGRKSVRISTRRPSLLGKPKPKPSRFGLLSSAKSLVQSVLNRGKAPIASNIPKPTVTNVNVSTKSAASKARMGPPSLGSKNKSSIAPTHPTTASGSRIPLPVKNQGIASSDSITLPRADSNQPPPTGRKPRISRSKVVAKLASQRAADGNGLNPTSSCRNSGAKSASNDTRRRTRSSVGAKVSRPNHGGGMSKANGEERVLLSAKKRARQSEYGRRKSKVVIPPLVMDGPYPVSSRMGVDGKSKVVIPRLVMDGPYPVMSRMDVDE